MHTQVFGWDIQPLSWEGILAALFCGALVGVERQYSGKPAGIRTSILVCLGSYGYVCLANFGTQEGDPTRIIGQVVTGVGFLGAGVMMTHHGNVLGVTSAAVIWVLAAMGAFIGMERFAPAVLISCLTLFVLVGINVIESRFKKSMQKGIHKHEEPDVDIDDG
ncbi:MAG: MgtC/SapB family protein [Flavobacteriales bacterium]|nr:MgtC/SapB family protein [Flavobacteriales bacterium]MCB9447976.1 MgtC/SapB family protein [Flavobacteriales bacterium]